jgi:hypothetical protein
MTSKSGTICNFDHASDIEASDIDIVTVVSRRIRESPNESVTESLEALSRDSVASTAFFGTIGCTQLNVTVLPVVGAKRKGMWIRNRKERTDRAAAGRAGSFNLERTVQTPFGCCNSVIGFTVNHTTELIIAKKKIAQNVGSAFAHSQL